MDYTPDETDMKILRILQDNARLTNKEIGEKLHKSPSSINDRIRRLQTNGVIKKYVALLDNKKINRSLVAFTLIKLRDLNKQSLMQFEKEIIKYPEVMECYHLSGHYDFIIRVAVENLDAYHAFLMNNLFESIPVGSIQSTFIMREAKADFAYPI